MAKEISGIKAARLERNLTQGELGQIAGICRQTISKLENGKLSPYNRTMLKLSASLGFEEPQVLLEKDAEYGYGLKLSTELQTAEAKIANLEERLRVSEEEKADAIRAKDKLEADLEDLRRHFDTMMATVNLLLKEKEQK